MMTVNAFIGNLTLALNVEFDDSRTVYVEHFVKGDDVSLTIRYYRTEDHTELTNEELILSKKELTPYTIGLIVASFKYYAGLYEKQECFCSWFARECFEFKSSEKEPFADEDEEFLDWLDEDAERKGYSCDFAGAHYTEDDKPKNHRKEKKLIEEREALKREFQALQIMFNKIMKGE